MYQVQQFYRRIRSRQRTGVLTGLLVLAVLLMALAHSVRPAPKWIPVLAEVTGLRMIRTHVHRTESTAGDWLIQYHLSYQVDGLEYASHLLVQHQQPLQSLSLTTRENEYWLINQEHNRRLPIQLWVNARHPRQIR